MNNNDKQSLFKKSLCIIKRILGVLLIVTGILGLVLPGLQGIAMIVAGSLLLGNKKILEHVKKNLEKLKWWWQKKKSDL